MACNGCSTGGSCGSSGCGKTGGCATGGCNRLNTFDWLSALDIHDVQESELVEVSFKNGSSKNFYINPPHAQAITGDWVVADTGNGFDVGKISLTGDLVNLQLKKKGIKADTLFGKLLRKANERDLQRAQEAREREPEMIVQARVISRSLKLDMKVCDIELQADHRKATFYYTADGRIDFRELIKLFASDFRVKVEMRQIGARQESARIGGIGSCGRELCCSTWLSDFKSVSTTAARYQNIAINQSKLSGQCGRLKCCLNYELDVYLDALEEFPDRADKIQTQAGNAYLVKTDIFKGILFYVYEKDHGRGKFYPLAVQQVKDILVGMKKGELVTSLDEVQITAAAGEDERKDYEDVTGFVELPPDKKRKKKKKKNPTRNPNQDNRNTDNRNQENRSQDNRNPQNKDEGKTDNPQAQQPNRENRPQQKRHKNRPNRSQNRPQNNQNKPNQPPPPDQPKQD